MSPTFWFIAAPTVIILLVVVWVVVVAIIQLSGQSYHGEGDDV